MDNHLAIVNCYIVLVQVSFFPDSLEELVLLWDILDLRTIAVLLGYLLHRFGHFALNIGDDNFSGKVNHLSCDGEIDNLLGEPVWVDLPAFGRNGCPFSGELLGSELEKVEIWYQDTTKRNVDECGEKDTQI